MIQKTFKLHRIIAALMLASVLIFAFNRTNPVASERRQNAPQDLKTNALSERNPNGNTSAALNLRAERRGFPLLNLQDGKKFQSQFTGGELVDARPLTLVNADLNADGAGDLIVGYAGAGGGGQIALYQASLDTLSARTPEIFEEMKEGRFPAPFLPEVKLINLPAAPDFIGTGDFNRDGWKDIITAQRGDNKAFLLLGNSKNSYEIFYVELPGQITAMMADNIDPLDNSADAAFAITGKDGASLLVYKGATDAFGEMPDVYRLPAATTSLSIGQLDDADPMDILAVGNGGAVIIHGAYPGESGQVEILFDGFDVAAGRVGNFVWDRENRAEIALLGGDGTVRILERGTLDKRMFSKDEWIKRSLSYRELMKEEEIRRNLNYKPQRTPKAFERWTESDRIQIAAPNAANRASSTSFFTSARMTSLGVEDLLLVDSANRQLHILIWNHDELKDTGESFALSVSGERAVVTLDVEAMPVAVLPMRLSVMNRPGIVLLNEGSEEISYALVAPAATFTVTKTADTFDGVCNADCSFREALQAANATAASDIIMIPAGTYTISPGLGGPDQDTTIDPAAEQSGDWDVFFDTTITGANQATTILQAAAAQPGHDRVLDAIQTGIGIPDLTISGVTIQNGRCQVGCVDGGGLRYAVDNQSILTINDSTINNNRTEVNSASPANNGGGIFGGQSDFSFTNMTVTNNFTAFVSGGCMGATQCGGEGGGVFAGIRFTANPTSVTMTNCTITGNTVNAVNGLGGRGGAYAGSPDSVSITGGTFNNNTAFTDAGAFRLFTPTTMSGATINNNSARQNGGGIWSDPLANDNTPLTNTFANVIMRGNTADSDGVIGPNNNNRGDGGAIFHGRGTLHLNNPTIGGTGAGEANTAFDGGGIARTYSQFTSAIFNASTLNINNGGSIVGNLAINNGGGIVNDATKTAATGNGSVLNIGTTTAVTITNNNARNHGGGIAVITGAGSTTPAASATLNNMTLRNNTANSDSSSGGDGGAFYQNANNVTGGGTTFSGTLTIGGSGFTNSAVNGGGISNAAGTLTLPANSSITFNTATGNGGGIFNGGTINSFSGATISNNSATTSGGGIFNNGTITVSGATINSNTAGTGSSVTQSGGTFNSAGTNTFGNNLAITGGTFNAGSSTVNLAGNFGFTGGTFTQGTSTFNFNGSAAQMISGTVTFNNLTINNASGVNLLSNETVGGTLTLTNGGLGVGSNTLTLNGAVSFTGGSINSNANGTVSYNQNSNGQAVAPGNYGNLTFSNFNKILPSTNINIAGTFTAGTAVGHTITGNTITFNGSALQTIPTFTFNNLTLNNAAGANLSSNVTVGGTMNLQTGNLGVGSNTLTLNGAATATGGTFSSAANGTVNYNQSSNGQAVLSGNYGNLIFSNFNKDLTNANISIAGTFTPGTAVGHIITGSSFTYNGTAAQTLPSGFTTYNNLTLNNAAGVTGFAGLTVNNLLRIQAGTFTSSSTYNNLQIDAGATLAGVNATTINIGGNWTNNGTFTANGNTVNFNGTATQTIGGSSTTVFNNLTINNAAGVNLSGNSTVGGILTLTAGTLGIGSSTLTLNGATTVTGGSLTSAANGTVNYNQNTNGQAVLALNYGNLTFSNFNKTLPGAGTIGVAGAFSPGTAVGHTITGSTFDFNGAGTQMIPGFTFNNLTTAGGGTKTLGNSITAGGNLLIGTATTLDISAGNYNLTVGGNFTNNGTFTPQAGTVSLNGNAAQTIGGSTPTTFNNLEINKPAADANLSLNTTVGGTLNLLQGNVSTGANVLNISASGIITRTSGHIIGNVDKTFAATGAFTYTVGTATGYSPVAVNVTALAVNPSTLRVRANDGTAATVPPLDDATTLDRFWSLTETGDLTADVVFNYLQTDVDGNENNYRTIRITGGATLSMPNGSPCPGAGSPCVDTGANTITVNNLSVFSDWTAGEHAPTAANVAVSGRVLKTTGIGLQKAEVQMIDGDGNTRRTQTNAFGYFRFDEVEVGQNYVFTIRHKQYRFEPRVISINEDVEEIIFTALPE